MRGFSRPATKGLPCPGPGLPTRPPPPTHPRPYSLQKILSNLSGAQPRINVHDNHACRAGLPARKTAGPSCPAAAAAGSAPGGEPAAAAVACV